MSRMAGFGRSDFDGIDTIKGSLRGLRSFQIIDQKITSPVQDGFHWGPGENKAFCHRTPPLIRRMLGAVHVAGQLGCSCGFYAYHTLEGEERNGYNGPLWGVIEGYGRVTVGTWGFRAQKARILALAWKPQFFKRVPRLPPGPSSPTIPLKDFYRLHERYAKIPIFDTQELLLAEFTLHNPVADLPPEPIEDEWFL